MDTIPDQLIAQIRDGNAVLFLGAGASLDAQDLRGRKPPTGRQLGELLADRFLGGSHRSSDLSEIGAFSISESDLVTVQEYIRQLFEDFRPTRTHELISTFRWRGIATTNYDCILEKAYGTYPSAAQRLAPVIENNDRMDDVLRDPQSVPYLKLHGCITRTTNPNCPLILSTDQYVQYRAGRSRVFDHLKEWGCERPIVFVGSALGDPDLRTLLLELSQTTASRPRYYFVAPDVDDIKRRFWETTHKITPIRGTCAEFFQAVDSDIPSTLRGVAHSTPIAHLPISQRFAVKDVVLSAACKQFLESDVEYVKAVTSTEVLAPLDFYRGINAGWAPIEQNLDVRRGITDTLLSDLILAGDDEHPDRMEFVVIKAHAGAGKTVLLRRLAWDAAHDFDALCLYLDPNGVISAAALQELVTACRERIYLFVDDLTDRVRELVSLAKNIGPDGRLVTVIGAARTNEWNVSGGPLGPLVTDSYELRYLSEIEIDRLLALLNKHRSLGTLASLPGPAQKAAFVERAGRQLLVALHEATLGRPFEDILEDEYKGITPSEAQRVYLTICALNRMNVPVRSGLIARIHGIRFEDFKERLFAPLEHIVRTANDPVLRDHTYVARHPHIADIVFERVLRTQEARYDEFVRILNHINIDYASDRRAFRAMMRGRTILELFPSHELASNVFALARKAAGDHDAPLFHQQAVYEMNRPSGSLKDTVHLLNRAAEHAPHDRAIKHSLAEYYLKSSEGARTDLERERCWSEATEICMTLKARGAENSYGHHTLVKIGVRRLKYLLEQPVESVADRDLEELLKDIEANLADGLQKFPGDAHLLTAEAEIANILVDSKRSMDALEKAFAANPRSAFIAMRLARCYERADKRSAARETLRRAIEANRNDRGLHFSFAQLLLQESSPVDGEILYHLQRSYSPGDTNYEAQLLYGRELFRTGDLENSKKVFKQLSNARVAPEFRDQLLHPLPRRVHGTVKRIEATYFFVARDGTNDWVYAHRSGCDESVWAEARLGMRLSFRVAFNLRGPGAIDIARE